MSEGNHSICKRLHTVPDLERFNQREKSISLERDPGRQLENLLMLAINAQNLNLSGSEINRHHSSMTKLC
jgi:hypothetical protein